MKSTSMITLRRKKKDIIIYIESGKWDNIPNLDFIVDVEILEDGTNQ